MRSLNIVISLSVIIFITTVAAVYSKNHNKSLNATSQENPAYIWEFKENGTLISRSDGNPARIQTFKIVNITPICGQDVDVDEKRETMYLVTKGEDGFEECSLMYFGENSKTEVYFWSVGMTVDATRGFIKKSKTRVEKL